MPYDVWVDEDGLYPDDCTYCGHPWMAHANTIARQCGECVCPSYAWREQPDA